MCPTSEGKRLLVITPKPSIPAETSLCFSDRGINILGPASGTAESARMVLAWKPDAAVIDLAVPTPSALWLDELLTSRDIPYIFAQLTGPPIDGHIEGFYLVNDDKHLSLIAKALFPLMFH